MSDSSSSVASAKSSRSSLLPMWAVLIVCAIPVVAAFLVYFLDLRPQAQTNYGELVEPQRDVPALTLTTLDGKPWDIGQLRGRWVMLSADFAACPESCAKKLFIARQVRASTGKNADRVERLWLVLDDAPVNPDVIKAYEGMHIVRASRTELEAWLPGPLQDHIWLIDPLHNLMMEFPRDPDPILLRKDLGKLLHNSRIG